MGGIYLSGGSGYGKSTFCQVMNESYGMPLIVNVIRGIHKKYPFISDLPNNERQLIYYTEYLKVHHTSDPARFLTDRSILNVLAFWGVDPEVTHYLGLKHKTPDLIILLPVPPYKWFYEHLSYFSDAIRISTYKKRAGVVKEHLNEDEVVSLFYEQDRDMFNRMKSMCEYLNWNYFIPEVKRSEYKYYQPMWQEQAHDKVVEVWGIENPKTIVKIREMGGDINGTQSASTED